MIKKELLNTLVEAIAQLATFVRTEEDFEQAKIKYEKLAKRYRRHESVYLNSSGEEIDTENIRNDFLRFMRF